MNIIVFGELPIASKTVEFLQRFNNVTIPCVVCENYQAKNADPWKDVPMLFDYAREKGIPVISLSELEEFCEKRSIEPSLGVLARFSKVLKAVHLKVFREGVINLHGGLLPEYAGLYSVNHMLLSGGQVGGGSIHWVDLGIDTGKLIKRCTCTIEQNDTAFTLHQKVQVSLYNGLCDILDVAVVKGTSEIPEEAIADDKVMYYSKNSLRNLKEIKFYELNTEKGLRKIRAFDFPGHEPAYTYIKGQKIELRYGFQDS